MGGHVPPNQDWPKGSGHTISSWEAAIAKQLHKPRAFLKAPARGTEFLLSQGVVEVAC